MLMAGLYLVGAIRLPTIDDTSKPGPGRWLVGGASLACAVWLFAAINGASLGRELDAFVPPSPYPGQAVAKGEEEEASLSLIGQALRRLDPGFDPRSYGHASLSSLVNALKDQLETRREEKGNTVMVRFRG
jgi:hypothetical protein